MPNLAPFPLVHYDLSLTRIPIAQNILVWLSEINFKQQQRSNVRYIKFSFTNSVIPNRSLRVEAVVSKAGHYQAMKFSIGVFHKGFFATNLKVGKGNAVFYSQYLRYC